MRKRDDLYRGLSMRRSTIAVAAVLAVAVLIVGCGGSKNQQSNGNGNTAGQTNTAPVQAQGKGSFKHQYDPVTDPNHAKLREDAMKARILELIAASLNQEIIIPVDITISLVECNVANAYYYPDQKRIHMCYELLDHFYTIFRPIASSEEDLHRKVYGATAHTFFHELGHALIDVLELPVTGKEEDAVDQLSTFILINGGDEGETAAINGANAFLLESQSGNNTNTAFWDEHSLNQQRFYSILCWIYGRDTAKYKHFVPEFLPEQRAVRCPSEYAQIEKSWLKLLGPHLKHQPKPQVTPPQ